MFGRLQIRHCFSWWERHIAPFIQSQKTRFNLQKKKTMRTKTFDARPHARRRRIRRSQLHSRLLFFRRPDSRSRFSHDGLPRSQREAPSCSEQNDQLSSRARIQPEQDVVGRGICIRSSTHRRDVHARSRTRTRMHQAGDIENSNGLSRHDRPTA